MITDPKNPGPAAQRYAALTPHREPYLQRARDASKLTVPALYPPAGHNATMRLYRPYQSVGSRGVNHLSSKLLMALFPPNAPFFRLIASPEVQKGLEQAPEIKSSVDSALAQIERKIIEAIESANDRPVLDEALKHMIVAGNVLFVVMPEGARAIPLTRYVVRRDGAGNVLEIVICEEVAGRTLDPELRAYVGVKADDDENVRVYTHVERVGDRMQSYQEINGIEVPGSFGDYPADRSPFIPLRMIRVDGEHYGRSFVEDIMGDLASLEALSKALVEGTAAASKVLFLVRPGSMTRPKTLAEAENGAIREGAAEDVTVLQVGKSADFSVTRVVMADITQRLEMAFLLNTAVQRQAERVTAEEIRYMAQELESALGGVYSALSSEFQIPYVRRRMALLQKAGALPALPDDAVRLSIVTGMEALGRGNDRARIVSFLQTLTATIGPQETIMRLNTGELIKRLGAAEGIDTAGLIKSDEQLAQEQQAAMLAQMAQQAAPGVLQKAGEAIIDNSLPQQGVKQQ